MLSYSQNYEILKKLQLTFFSKKNYFIYKINFMQHKIGIKSTRLFKSQM